MKNKLSIILYTAVVFLIASCSASKSAMAQSNDDQYNNGYNQPPPADQNYNNQSQDQNNQDYNNQNQDQNDQQYQDNQNGNADQYNNQDDQGDSQDYTNDGNNNNSGQDYDNGYSDGANAQAQADVNMNDFNSALSPYGTWMDYPSYGRVWVCGIRGFRPYYSGGHWVYTNFGWTWASDYAWGWAPFHYGRWAFEARYGWMWVPGYQWGPAWVGWRTGGDYYGWAPLSPGIRIGFGTGFGGYGYIPSERWCFVPHGYIGYRNINRYFISPRRNVTIIRNTTIINNVNIYRRTAIVNGPSRTEVERYTGRPIQQVRVVNTQRPGAAVANGNTIGIYRPRPAVNNTNNINRNQINNTNVIRPNNQQIQGNGQHNINNLPERGNIINRPPVNQAPQNVPRNIPNNVQPSRPNIQPMPQQQQPRNLPPHVNNGQQSNGVQSRIFQRQQQQPGTILPRQAPVNIPSREPNMASRQPERNSVAQNFERDRSSQNDNRKGRRN